MFSEFLNETKSKAAIAYLLIALYERNVVESDLKLTSAQFIKSHEYFNAACI